MSWALAYDLNLLLRVLNRGAILITVLLYIFFPGQPYMDRWSLILAASLSILLELFLSFEAKRRNPLLLFFVLHTLLFYAVRFASLIVFPDSVVLYRGYFPPPVFNAALIQVIILIGAFGAGLAIRGSSAGSSPKAVDSPWKVAVVFNLLLGAVLAKHLLVIIRPELAAHRFMGYLDAIFNPAYLYMLAIIFLTACWKSVHPTLKIAMIALLTALSVSFVLGGQRSLGLIIVLGIFFGALARDRSIRVSRRVVLLGLMMVVPAILAFDLAFHIRKRQGDLKEAWRTYFIPPPNAVLPRLAPLAERLGALDMAVEMVAYADRYARIANPAVYLRSFIDNSSPTDRREYKIVRTSNMMKYVYLNLPPPKRTDVQQGYHSDMFTPYAESRVLFGFPISVLVLFGVGCLLARAYARLEQQGQVFANGCALFLYYYFFLNSYGFDWSLIDLSRMAVMGLVFLGMKKFVSFTRRSHA